MPEQQRRVDAAILRHRAERQLADHASAAAESDAQLLVSLHELQVHQIELQMQNEALQASEAAAREAMQALAGLNDRLESLVASRTAELVAARDAAEAANRGKSTFLANMSHELRTPLTGVMGMIELARRRASDAQQADWLNKAHQSAQHLLALINDVLDISKIESGRLTLSDGDFSLGPLLADLSTMLATQLQGKDLALAIEIDPALAGRTWRGDRLRLLQILLNLAGNAIKFTDTGQVTVRVSAPADAPGSGSLAGAHAGVALRFEVQDSGIGIAPQDQARLFGSFEQIDSSTTRRQGGTGLGLAICRHLAELMGGQIGVHSQLGAGSLFWVNLRLRPGQAAAPSAAAPSPGDVEDALRSSHAGRRVLLAEDNPIIQTVIRALIEHVELVVDVAADGAAAVEMASAHDYALILMDLQMPALNGPDAARAVRAIPGRQQVPIIALTASAFDQDRLHCIESGMDDHLGKPVPPEALYAMLLKWLP